MAQLILVYWRDIPAQVTVREGRKAERRQLSERFEQAIDRAAMRAGARDSDAYIAEWRRGEPVTVEGSMTEIVEREKARIEAAYPPERLRALVDSLGHEPVGKD